MDVDGAGTYMCNYKYPDKQIFSMQFDVNVRFKVDCFLSNLSKSTLNLRIEGRVCNRSKQVNSPFIFQVAELRGPADVVRNVTVNEDRYTQSLSCDLSGLADAGISR